MKQDNSTILIVGIILAIAFLYQYSPLFSIYDYEKTITFNEIEGVVKSTREFGKTSIDHGGHYDISEHFQCEYFSIKQHPGGPTGFFKNSLETDNILLDIVKSEKYGINSFYNKHKNTIRYDEASNQGSFRDGLVEKYNINEIKSDRSIFGSYVVSRNLNPTPMTPYIECNSVYDILVLQDYMKNVRGKNI